MFLLTTLVNLFAKSSSLAMHLDMHVGLHRKPDIRYRSLLLPPESVACKTLRR